MNQKKSGFVNSSRHLNTNIETDSESFPLERYHPGDSVAKHKTIEDANLIHTEDEIKQQNENL